MTQNPNYDRDRDGQLEPNWQNFTVEELSYEEARLRAKAEGTDDRSDSCTCRECHQCDRRHRKTIHRGLMQKLKERA